MKHTVKACQLTCVSGDNSRMIYLQPVLIFLLIIAGHSYAKSVPGDTSPQTFTSSESKRVNEKPMRIASLGLCTDQLLLQMVEPERIVALSNMAQHPTMSFMAEKAKQLGKPSANLEALVKMKPDLIVGTDYSTPEVSRILSQLGFNVKTTRLPNRYNEIPDMIRLVGEWTGEQQTAENIIADMNKTLKDTQKRIQGKPKQTAMIFSPNGYTIGNNTIENDLMLLAGFNNLAAEIGIEGFKQVSLEHLVSSRPDVVMIDNHILNEYSLANQLLSHPVLEKVAGSEKRKFIPSRLRACAGPMTALAVKYLVDNR